MAHTSELLAHMARSLRVWGDPWGPIFDWTRRKYRMDYYLSHMAAHLAHIACASGVDCRVVARFWRICRDSCASNFRLDQSHV